MEGLVEEHIKLSWDLIGYKIAYYYPERLSSKGTKRFEIEDWKYDQMETRYVELCSILEVENTVCHKEGEGMMEVDFSKPSVQLVLEKYGKKQTRKRRYDKRYNRDRTI